VHTHINVTPTDKQEPLHDRPAARTRPSPDPRPTKTMNRGGNRRGAHRPRSQAGSGNRTHRTVQHDISHHGGDRMSYPYLTGQATAVTAAVAELDVHPEDGVLIMLPRRSRLC
jgi:hypothetical protein